jgi:hypothetical protein
MAMALCVIRSKFTMKPVRSSNISQLDRVGTQLSQSFESIPPADQDQWHTGELGNDISQRVKKITAKISEMKGGIERVEGFLSSKME